MARSDAAALREAPLRVSALVTAMPEIDELDLNPVSVLPEGQGVRVLDARVHIGQLTRTVRGS